MRTEDGDYLRVSAHSSQNTFSSNLFTLKQEKKLPRSYHPLISIAFEKGHNDFVDPVLLSVLLFPDMWRHNWAELLAFLMNLQVATGKRPPARVFMLVKQWPFFPMPSQSHQCLLQSIFTAHLEKLSASNISPWLSHDRAIPPYCC